jgi:hypothetical protein
MMNFVVLIKKRPIVHIASLRTLTPQRKREHDERESHVTLIQNKGEKEVIVTPGIGFPPVAKIEIRRKRK